MTETTLVLPLGQLTLAEDGSAHAVLPVSLRNRDAVLAAVEALAQLSGGGAWIYDERSEDAAGLHLRWLKPGGVACPLHRIVARWRQKPVTALPSALELTREVLRVAGELESLRPLRFLLSPAQVFSVQDGAGNEHWRVLPLPVEGAGLADFMQADEVFWTWLSAESLLKAAPADRGYMLGAAVYFCLVADLLPPAMSRSERARRLLLSHTGNPTRARSALAAALPKDLAPLASRLADLVIGQLGPALGRPSTAAQAIAEFDRIAEELTAQDFTGPAAPASLIGQVRELVTGGEPKRLELEQLMAALRKARGSRPADADESPFTEEQCLYLAYVDGRWMANTGEALQWLRRDFSVSLHKVVQSLLAGRFSVERADWSEVLRNCRDSRQLIARMPGTGGEAGRYAEAYANLLDGIAHVSVVESQRHSWGYLTDAFDRLAAAWSQLHEVEGEDLEPAALDWLSWLAALAGGARLGRLQLGVEAFFQSLGLELRRGNGAVPAIPWFDERRLFSAMG